MGGAVATLAFGGNPTRIALGAANLCWTDASGSSWRCPSAERKRG
ncbi:MAG TPA: hypothetical protein VKU41_04130 [Polyangiaceae bacterium]|nr:hypothetical protein [Polyangiaceae bacterium]